MTTDGEGATGGRPKTPVDQCFEWFVYAPLGFALDARQLLPRFIDRGRSQVVLARVVGRYAVKRGSKRAGDYLEQSGNQVSAVLHALGVLPDEPGPAADPADLDDFEGEVLTFESAARTDPSTGATFSRSPEQLPDVAVLAPRVENLAIPDYDNLSASQVVPRLGGLSSDELDDVLRYESAKRARKTILNKIAQLRSA
jgi:hypothetical protein